MPNELKSCPFCGAEPFIILEEFEDGDKWYRTECSVFGCCGWQQNYHTKKEAIVAWNRRANDEQRD